MGAFSQQTIIEQIQAFHKGTKISTIEKNTDYYLTLLQPDGAFTDIDYTERAQTNWKPITHLDRLKIIVQAYTMTGSKYLGNNEIYDRIVQMLRFWYQTHPTSTNWYMQQIACPQRMGVLLILMRSGATPLPADLEKSLIDRIKAEGGRPDQKGSLGTAANKLDIATHWIYRGCLTADKAVLSFGVEQAYHPLRLTTDEGLQHDFSYQQHGSQLYIGGYGWVVIDGISKIATYMMGTPYELSGEKLQLLSSFVRESYLPIIRGQHFLYNVLGRGLSRKDALNQSGMAVVTDRMITLDPSHADTYKKAKHRLSHTQQADYGLQPKHTHFWRSDYTLHQRPGYTIDVRMVSKYTGRNENGNGENLKGYFLADGAMDIATTGDEYVDIFPVWDWTRIPGVTAPVLTTIPQPTQWYVGGTSSFAGGVSDGKYGATAYLLNGDKNNVNTGAHKSWFFFDDEVVCLGAGIHSSSSEKVNTTINQCLLKGPVTACISQEETTLPDDISKTSNRISWVHHNGVGYFFPQGGNITVEKRLQTGNWKAINNSLDDAPVNKEVFKMWLEHDTSSANEKYAYIIVPNKETADDVRKYKMNNITIMANTDSVQAVKHNVLNLWGVVFYKKATFRYDSVSIHADKGCVLWIKDIGSTQVKVHVADSSRMQSDITLLFTLPSIKGIRELKCKFPVHPDPYAGASSEYVIF